jgi:DNA-binding NarL/FixJ family response regulator
MSEFIGALLATVTKPREAGVMDGVPTLSVLLVGSDAGFRAALRDRLERDGILVCGEAADAACARRVAIEKHPDACVIADWPPFDAVAAATMVGDAAEDVRIMLVGDDPSDSRLLEAVDAGACGYLSDDSTYASLTATLLDTAAGRSGFPRRLEALLIERLHGA